MINPTRQRLYPRERDPVPIAWEAGWAPGPVWTGAENLTPHRELIPGPISPQWVAIPIPLTRPISRLHKCVYWLYLKKGGLNIPSLWAHKTFQSLYLQVVNNRDSRAKLADNIVKFAKQYGFDGIDLDWEYPTDKVSNYISLLKKWI